MRYSRLFGKPRKTSKEFDSINATLLIKGGFIDQTMAGAYTYLTLGTRVLQKIEQLVREEMDKIAAEVFMPSIVPKELWEQTGRLDTVDVLMKTTPANKAAELKHNTEYVLNSTHEEVITPLAKKFYHSERDFPIGVYQIQTKFRNEPRVKSGLLRGREFRMKDLYSFHASEQDMKSYYEKAKDVYWKVFERLGLKSDTLIVFASGGDFTEDYSHEFQTKCEKGEDTIFYVKSQNIAYNKEIAPSVAPKVSLQKSDILPKEDVLGENIIGVKELAKFLKIPIEQTTKTLIFETDNGIVAVAVRGGYDVNEEKLKKIIKSKKLHLASVEVVKKITGADIGYAGILNLPKEVGVYWDESTKGRVNFEMGSNKTNYHSVNVNFGRDVEEPKEFYDFKIAKEGDFYPETNEKYEVIRGAEVGNIFPLYTKFSDAFNYKYLDENNKEQSIYMGCYGIGTSRLMGVLVEKFHDDKGIVWPENVAPYQVHLVGLDLQDEDVKKKAEDLYRKLTTDNQIEVLFDDREEVRAGEKFADADLIGIPHRLVVSKKTGVKIEYKKRTEDKSQLISLEDLKEKLRSRI